MDILRQLWISPWMDWVVFAAYLAGTWLIAALARRLLRAVVPLLTARASKHVNDRWVKAATAPVRLAILAMGLRVSLQVLVDRIPIFQQGHVYYVQFVWAQNLVDAMVVLAITALVNALLKAAMDWYIHDLAAKSHANWDEELLPLFRRLLSLLLYFVAASVIFEKFGYPITALVTTAGVASLAVALAAQETLSNMLGGLVILVDRPFRVGDVIELSDGKAGEVVEIGLRSTHIKQADGNALVVPNKDMASSRVINYALPTVRAAIRQTIVIDFAADVELAKVAIQSAMQAQPEVLADPAPGVWFSKFGETGLELFMACWVASYKEKGGIADQLNLQILKNLRTAGIAVAVPQRTLHVQFPEAGEEIRRQVGKDTNQA